MAVSTPKKNKTKKKSEELEVVESVVKKVVHASADESTRLFFSS